MTRWLMRRLPPGGFAWLVLYELGVTLAARRGEKRWPMLIGWGLLAAWTAIGCAVAYGLRDIAIEPAPEAYVVLAAVALALLSFMTTQALLASQRTLYEAGDLDLLFSAPIEPRVVLSAKLVGIVGAIVLTFALLVLPIALPTAVLGHPGLFGVVALLLALALFAACLGLALTLLFARIAGPRAARTVGQVVAALSGGAIFLASQFLGNGGRGGRSGFAAIFEWLESRHVGTHGITALPGRAAFGDPLAIALLLGGGLLLFAATSAAMRTLFLSAYRAGGMRLAPRRIARGRIARHFHRGLFGAVFAKEWRLLARDPALAFQVVLRLIYLAPLFLVIFRENVIPLAPSLAFLSVTIAGQVVGSFAWLAVSAEDSPDLLKVAPVEKEALDNAKLLAAMAMALPLALILPIAIATETLAGALVALAFTGLGGWAAGQLEVAYAVPAPRSTFQRRRSGSLLRGLFQFLITGLLGAIAAGIVYFL